MLMNREFLGLPLHPSAQVSRCPLEMEVRGVFHDHARLPRLEASACGRSPLALLSARRAAYAGARAAGAAEWWPSELEDLVEGLYGRACWGGLPHTSSLSFYLAG